eukprot:405129-Pleurochrysis_carterae.AAC.1
MSKSTSLDGDAIFSHKIPQASSESEVQRTGNEASYLITGTLWLSTPSVRLRQIRTHGQK